MSDEDICSFKSASRKLWEEGVLPKPVFDPGLEKAFGRNRSGQR